MDEIPHISEKYYCMNCNDFRKLEYVQQNWKCPICNNHVEIHIKTENLNNSCYRVPVKELKVGDLVLMNRKDEFREVLGIELSYKNKNSLLISLKNYGSTAIDKNFNILKLNGGWYH